MEKFILIFRNHIDSLESYDNRSAEEMQAELQLWMDWIGGIAAQGKLVETNRLIPSGKVISGASRIVSDGPFVEAKELTGGYLILQAASIDEAVELSKGCPVLHYQGLVEVRQILARASNS